MNKLFYYDNMMSPDGNYRSNWDGMYEQIRRFNEYFYDVHSGFADKLDSDQLAIRTAEVRFMRALFYYHALDFYRNIPSWYCVMAV